MVDPDPPEDQWFKELLSSPKLLPSVAALSRARFLSSVDPTQLGSRLYFDDVVPMFLDALENMKLPLRDPDRNTELQSALNRMVDLGETSQESTARFRSLLAAEPDHESPRRLGEDSAAPAFPVVQDIIGHPRKPRSFLGVIARARIYPETVHQKGAQLEILTGGNSIARGTLESVRSVAEVAYSAAVAVAPPRQRGFLGWHSRKEHHVFRVGIQEFAVDLRGDADSVAGNSVGLALAVGFLGALVGLHRSSGLGFRSRPRVAWSGVVDEAGCVHAVGRGSLEAKVRAAYFDSFEVMVVPRSQMAIAEDAVPEREQSFRIIGIEHLRAILHTEGVTERWRLPKRIRRAPKSPLSPWRILGAILGVPTLVVFALLALLNFLWGGQSYSLDEDDPRRLLIIQTGLRPPTLLDTDVLIRHHGVYGNLAGDPYGSDRLVVATQFGPIQGGDGSPVLSQLRVYELSWLPFQRPKLMWRYTFEVSGLPYDPVRAAPDIQYNPLKTWVGNLDDHPANEIVVATTAHPYSPTIVHLFAGLPYPTGAIAHPGHPAMADPQVINLGSDRGKAFVLFCKANRVNGAAILALQRDNFIPVDFATVRESSEGGWEPDDYVSNRPKGEAVRLEGPVHVSRESGAPSGIMEFPGGSELPNADRPVTPSVGTHEDPEMTGGCPPYDRARQECLSYITIPDDPNWSELRYADTSELLASRVYPRNEDGAPILAIGITCRFDGKRKTDYFARIALPDTLIRFEADAPMVAYAKTLLRSGRTTVDLASPDFVDKWASQFRYHRYVYWDTVDTGRPMVRP